jgi:pimeloyl-ACP methyl ester carboxylesterase
MTDNRLKPYAMLLLLAACFVFLTAGCSDRDKDLLPDPENPEIPGQPDDPPWNVSSEVLREYSFDGLKAIERSFTGGIPGEILNITGNRAKYEGDVQMRVYKVMLEVKHPGVQAAGINLSGVLIVPPPGEGRVCRQVIAPAYTFVMKEEAPTVRVADGNLDSHLMFWLLEAYRNGYAVMIPDYPGFGDSYGQCFIPYVEKEAMVRTTAQYVEAARYVLSVEKYGAKGGFIISGYSLGAYVSLQLAREYETAAAGDRPAVDLLVTGGSPCNLLHEAALIRASSTLPQPHLFPLALLGYVKNSYPHLVMTDYLNEPYASGTAVYLDGQHAGYEDFFTRNTPELFTANFLKNEGMDGINGILDSNSVKPWKNSCRFVMTHGADDETVYYAQARDFAAEQEKYGGSVSFVRTLGTHTGAGVWFYLRLYTELLNFISD